jgi:two-component system response regulator MprA
MKNDLAPPLILVADDDPEIRELLAILLSDEGYRVVVAADGLRALDVAREESPGLILLDVSMPRLDGPGFCLAYREGGGAAPIVVLSATLDAAIEATVEACGAVAHVVKPFEIDDLLSTIATAIAA